LSSPKFEDVKIVVTGAQPPILSPSKKDDMSAITSEGLGRIRVSSILPPLRSLLHHSILVVCNHSETNENLPVTLPKPTRLRAVVAVISENPISVKGLTRC